MTDLSSDLNTNAQTGGSGNVEGEVTALHDPVGRLFKIGDLCRELSLSRATIYRMLQEPDYNFPRPVKIGMASRWLECDIIAWKEQLAAIRAV